MKVVNDLGRKLFYHYRPGTFSSPSSPWDVEPAMFLAGLEETVEGCCWAPGIAGVALGDELPPDADVVGSRVTRSQGATARCGAEPPGRESGAGASADERNPQGLEESTR